jgi:hypothetical protein
MRPIGAPSVLGCTGRPKLLACAGGRPVRDGGASGFFKFKWTERGWPQMSMSRALALAIWRCGAEPSAYAISSRLTDSAWVARLVGAKTARAAKCHELAESARPVYLGDVYIRVAIRYLSLWRRNIEVAALDALLPRTRTAASNL